jgi:hypothetical protein
MTLILNDKDTGHQDCPRMLNQSVALSHDEVVFIKLSMKMEEAQKERWLVYLWLVRIRKHTTIFVEGSQKCPLEQACNREMGKEMRGKRRGRRGVYRIFNKVLIIVNIIGIDRN